MVRPGGLGDSLLLAPALSILRKQSSFRISLVGYPTRLEPLVASGLAEGATHIDTWLNRHPDPGQILSFIDLPEGLRTAPGVAIHPPFPDSQSGKPVAIFLGESLGVAIPTLTFSPLKNLLRTESDRPPTIWIHPGAGAISKRWPLENFLSLADQIKMRMGREVQFLLGDAELDLMKPLEANGHSVMAKEKVLDLTAEWVEGDGFVGNDSGVAHLAGLCGLNTVVIFGETDPLLWRPCGESVQILKNAARGKWPTIEEVLQAIAELMVGEVETKSQ
ncbi:MAG: glycosyltransferase family 9 protein [Candidatus Omnitrophica bacterium]|nr:glycosyltransferase family 9 protein [Candidatus Omnitrophota bacterium]